MNQENVERNYFDNFLSYLNKKIPKKRNNVTIVPVLSSQSRPLIIPIERQRANNLNSVQQNQLGVDTQNNNRNTHPYRSSTKSTNKNQNLNYKASCTNEKNYPAIKKSILSFQKCSYENKSIFMPQRKILFSNNCNNNIIDKAELCKRKPFAVVKPTHRKYQE